MKEIVIRYLKIIIVSFLLQLSSIPFIHSFLVLYEEFIPATSLKVVFNSCKYLIK